MAHQHFHTEAIVLKTIPHGEVSKTVMLFTREFGLIYARAQGVRKVTSKMRLHLQEYNLLTVSLVRGRDAWRIVGVSHSEPVVCGKDPLIVCAKSFALLARLVQGEETQPALFDDIKAGCALLSSQKDSGACENVEIVLVLRLLYHLGYISPGTLFADLLPPVAWSNELANRAADIRKEVIFSINNSIAHSHL